MVAVRHDILNQTVGPCAARKVRDDDKRTGRDKNIVLFTKENGAPGIGEESRESFIGDGNFWPVVPGVEVLIKIQQAGNVALGRGSYMQIRFIHERRLIELGSECNGRKAAIKRDACQWVQGILLANNRGH